jgi:hypothetical protein
MLVFQTAEKNNTTISLRDLGLKAGLYIIGIETANFVKTDRIIYSPD